MKTSALNKITSLVILLLTFAGVSAQTPNQTIVISGELIAEPLVAEWAREYAKLHPEITLKFVANAPNADFLIDFANPQEKKKSLDYFPIAKTALLPIANAQSSLAVAFGEKGLTKEDLKYVYFEDLFAEEKKSIKELTHQPYTRLGDAGIPLLFSVSNGYTTSQIRGKAIAGNDFHVIKAIGKDPEGVGFSAINLIYDATTRKVKDGLVVIPSDINGNGRVTAEEKIFATLDDALTALQGLENTKESTVTVASLHISANNTQAQSGTIEVLKWILADGQHALAKVGFLQPDADTLEKAIVKLDRFAINQQPQP